MSDTRILILSFPHSSEMGGGERYTEDMVRGLHDAGAHVTLVSSSKALLSVFAKNRWESRAIFGGFEPVTKLGVILFMLTAPVFLVLNASLLLWYRFGKKVDTVICLSMTEKLLVTTLATALKMRVIWMEHLMPGRSVTLNPYRSLLLSNAKSAEIVTVSEVAKSALGEAGYPEKSITIISPSAHVPPAPPGPSDDPVIGCVARLHKEKGVMTLIDAFTDIAKDDAAARLEIYGDGEEREGLEALVKERRLAGRISFRGWIDSRKGFYRNFRLLAVPSEKESFGMAALEAMASGIPVVASDVGGLSTLIKDKVTGLLVPPHDPAALADAIRRLLRDPAYGRKLGEAGHTRAEDRYSEERFHTSWRALLNV